MARDPPDPQWAEKLNRINPHNLPVEDSYTAPEEAEDDPPPASDSARANQQRTLWE